MMSKCRFRGVVVVGQVLLTALALTGCDALQNVGLPGQGPKFETKSSGLVFGLRIGLDPIYWLDNDRALFPAYTDEKRIGPDGKEDWAPPGIFIWDTKSNTYTRHADLQNQSWFMCFNKGFIAYSIEGEGHERKTMKAGMLGQDKQLRTDINWGKHPELEQCKNPVTEILPAHRGALIVHLRPQDGYIYVGPYRDDAPGTLLGPDESVQLYQPKGDDRLPLSILAKELDSNFKLSYSAYADKYIIVPGNARSRDMTKSDRSWPRGQPIPIYLLTPGGKLETIEIPYGTWHPAAAFMTRRGLFWVSNDAPSTNSKQAGGWLLQDGKVTKLFEHLVDGAGVSPDGCKIVYANNDFNRNTTEFVQVIELCK